MVGPGLRVANSVVTVLPMTTAPAARAQATGAESALGCQLVQIGEPYWLGMSAVSSTSLTPMGMPCSGPGLRGGCGGAGLGGVEMGEGLERLGSRWRCGRDRRRSALQGAACRR